MKSQVFFGEEKLKQKYQQSAKEDIFKWLENAINDLEQNAFCGIQIPKKIIPKKYLRQYELDNLWKYNLPQGHRLLYTVANNEQTVITILIDWLTHKEYERIFKY